MAACSKNKNSEGSRLMIFENTPTDIGWGVDGFGVRHYLCDYCEIVFGDVDPDEIAHKCDTSKPRYYNRDRRHDSITASKSGRA